MSYPMGAVGEVGVLVPAFNGGNVGKDEMNVSVMGPKSYIHEQDRLSITLLLLHSIASVEILAWLDTCMVVILVHSRFGRAFAKHKLSLHLPHPYLPYHLDRMSGCILLPP